MQRLYEWLRAIWQEKVNLFIKGFFGGGFICGIFLFGGPIHAIDFPLLAYFVKVVAIGVSGVISGCATVLGNDFAKWLKKKWAQLISKKKRK